MSTNTYTFPMEKLRPNNTNGDKGEVKFYWDAASQTWSVTWNGQPVFDVVLAAELIAAAKAQGMVDPQPEPEPESEQEQQQEQDEPAGPR
ncbi:MAG: hypothetical protein WC695_11375 [Candidatus Omnitrophota bacterium]